MLVERGGAEAKVGSAYRAKGPHLPFDEILATVINQKCCLNLIL